MIRLLFIAARSPANTSLEFQITRGTWGTKPPCIPTYGRYAAPKVPFIIKIDTLVTIRPSNWNDFFNRSITGTVKYYHNFEDHDLRYTRDVVVWLPPSYYKSPNKKYPVLYAHDGQNVFAPGSVYNGEWRMDETADSLMRAGKTEEFIIVAINNTKDRWVEYSGTAEGMAYMNFIVHNLKPFIDKNYRTKPDRNNTAMIGSSMGGLTFLLHGMAAPGCIFESSLLIPSGFAYDDGHIVDTVAASAKKIPGTRIYLDCGDQELDKYFLPDNNRMKTLLEKKHPEAKLMYRVFNGAFHNEFAWSKRLDIPFIFLFGIHNEN